MEKPHIVTYTLTRQCNLSCKHCYTKATSSPDDLELDTNEARNVISQVAAAGTKIIIFDGGEPTLREDLPELIAHARDEGLHPVIGTNATTMTPSLAETLKETGLASCAVSLDGSNAAIHDDFRGVPGSFDMAIEGMRILSECGIPFQIDPCISSANCHDIESIIEFAKKLGARAIETFEFVPTGKGDITYSLTVEQKKYVTSSILKHSDMDGIPFRMVATPQFDVLKDITKNTKTKHHSCCSAGRNMACIFYDGTVYPCILLQKPAGNVREESFSNIWKNSPVFKTLRDRNNLLGKCGTCYFNDVCGGARCKAFSKSGNMMAEDPDCWLDINI